MNVHGRNGSLHRAQDIPIIKRWQAPRQPALNADFGRPEFPGLNRFCCDLLRIEKISVGLSRSAAEGTEFASDKTNIGEINIAIYDVGDNVTRQFSSQLIRRDEHSEKIVAFCDRQQQALFAAHRPAVLGFQHALDYFSHFRAASVRYVCPLQMREAFEFRACAGSLRHDFLHRSTEQIVCARPYQLLRRPPATLVAESAHNAKWRSIKLAAD